MKNIILIALLGSLFLSNVTNANTNPTMVNDQMVQQYLVNQMLLKQASKTNSNKNTDVSNVETNIPAYYVNDDYRIERRDRWSRYCIEGIQYISSDHGNSHTFTTLVDKDGKPLQCIAVPKNDK
jgi:hypothetical protein